MAEQAQQTQEKEYTIPLRREWQKVARYKRTSRGIKTIKQYIARHMRVPDRDPKKIKLDIYLNNEIWARGAKKPPSKIRVKAIKKGDIVEVTLVHESPKIGFARKRQDKRHSIPTKKRDEPKDKDKKEDKKLEDKIEEKDKQEDVKAEKEKEKSVEEVQQKTAEISHKAAKHSFRPKNIGHAFRKALKK